MIRTLLLCTWAVLAHIPLTHAQDLGISYIDHIELSEVKGGASKFVLVVVDVNETVPDNSTFNVSYSIDGATPIQSVEEWPVLSGNSGQQLPPVRCPVPFGKNFNDTVKLTMILDFDGDKDASNDTAHIGFIVREVVPNDLSITLLSPDPGSDLKTDEPHELIYSVKNVGTTTLTSGDLLLEFLRVNDQVVENPSFEPYAGNPLNPGDSFTTSVYFTFPEQQQGESVEICNNIFWAQLNDNTLNTIEGNHGDNSSCATFNVVANSISEITETSILQSITLAQGILQFTASETATGEKTRIRLLDATGKLLLDEALTLQPGTHQYSLPTLSQSIYLVQLQIEGKAPVASKIFYRP